MARIQELTFTRGNRLLLLLALIAGAVAAALVFVALSEDDIERTSVVSDNEGTRTVVVAAADIAPGTAITAEMVKQIEVPEALTLSGVYADSALVVGQKARVKILSGEQLVNAKVGVQDVDQEGLQYVVPDGKRAVALRVEQVTAVGGLLLPGNHVDVLAAERIEHAPGLADDEDIIRVYTVLQNVEVLAVAQEAQQPVPAPAADAEAPAANDLPTSGQLPEDPDEQPDAATVTLALDPAQVQVLVSAQEVALRVWAALRAFGDNTVTDVQPYDRVVVED